MASWVQVAALADLLPASAPKERSRTRFRLPRLRRSRPRGLEAVPERYRLQLILMTADAMPGAAPDEQAKAAAELAERVRGRIPARITGTDGRDAWFRQHAEEIAAMAKDLAARWRA